MTDAILTDSTKKYIVYTFLVFGAKGEEAMKLS